MTLDSFIKTCKKYLTSKGCKINSCSSYLTTAGMIKECEFTYKGKEYRLSVDRYNRIKIYNHEPYPTEMDHYERILQGKLVYEEIIRKEGLTFDKFFQEN